MDNRQGNPYFEPTGELARHRRRLPHWQQGHAWTFVTWRLGDSLPAGKLAEWRRRIDEATVADDDAVSKADADTARQRQLRQWVDAWLDRGHGACWLRDPVNAKIVAEALLHFNNERYQLSCFAVMPNHVHILWRMRERSRLATIVQAIKGYSAQKINARLGRSGRLWQPEYWDRIVRGQAHFVAVKGYVLGNPKVAGLGDGEFVVYDAATEMANTDRDVRAP